jgi:hypothetical protein
MSAAVIQNAIIDPARLRPFQACVDDYEVGDQDDPWANNCLAYDAVAYSNGLISRKGAPVDLRYDDMELTLCSRLATESARLMGPRWPGMYGTDAITAPYFVTSESFGPLPALDARRIREVFGEALFADANIEVETLAERGTWWDEVQRCAADSAEDDPDFDPQEKVIKPWQSIIRWFACRPELHGSSFVRIWVENKQTLQGGCVFPWFVVGLTQRGALAGISTCICNA